MSVMYPAIVKPPVLIDGSETLHITVEWRGGHRDRVRVVHFPVGAPTAADDDAAVDMSKVARIVRC